MPPAQQDQDAAIALRHDRADMERLANWIDRRVEALALSPAAANAVRLCLEEAVINVITHNDPPADPAASIQVCLDRCDGRLTVRIEDRCAPFDPLAAPERAQPEGLEDAPIGGLGIKLMRSFASTLEYRREDGANRLLLRFDD
jgi:anti-sigma regulatory factor (Ser/Thr protein kinase)